MTEHGPCSVCNETESMLGHCDNCNRDDVCDSCWQHSECCSDADAIPREVMDDSANTMPMGVSVA